MVSERVYLPRWSRVAWHDDRPGKYDDRHPGSKPLAPGLEGFGHSPALSVRRDRDALRYCK